MNEAVQDDAMGASPTAPDPGSTTVPERDPRPTSVPAASPALPPADAPDDDYDDDGQPWGGT